MREETTTVIERGVLTASDEAWALARRRAELSRSGSMTDGRPTVRPLLAATARAWAARSIA